MADRVASLPNSITLLLDRIFSISNWGILAPDPPEGGIANEHRRNQHKRQSPIIH